MNVDINSIEKLAKIHELGKAGWLLQSLNVMKPF